MRAKIKRLSPDIELPKYQTAESAAFDVAANADMVIKAGEIVKIPTGLIIESPEGHFLMLVARGSTAAKTGLKLSNGVGIIDRDFAGPNDEVFLPMHNFTDHDTTIRKGDRIAQGMFIRVNQVEWEDAVEIRAIDRGGYGSTGGYQS